MDIIGIDPGSLRTGWGIVRERSGVLSLVDSGIIRTTRPANENAGFSARLAIIYSSLCSVIEKFKPEECAIEQIFTAQNASSALKLGQARGVAVAACATFSLPVFDYEPTLVKKNITGNGRAEKVQVSYMISRLLNISKQNWPFDITDALGVAICHFSQRRISALSQAI